MIDREEFRRAMSLWPSGVTIVAVRYERRVVATTVTAFLSLSLDPPRILVALGPNATVRPFLTPGQAFGVSVLSAGQKRLATIFADPFPVGADPFPAEGTPLVPAAHIALDCRVTSVLEPGDHALVVADVLEGFTGDTPPLIRYRRRYVDLPDEFRG